MDTVPEYRYKVEDVYINKSIAMEYGHNTVAVCYEIENGSEEAKLNLVPLFNYREAGETSERSELKFDVKVCEKTLTLIPNNNKDIKIEFYTSEGSYYDRSLIPTSMATTNYLIFYRVLICIYIIK